MTCPVYAAHDEIPISFCSLMIPPHISSHSTSTHRLVMINMPVFKPQLQANRTFSKGLKQFGMHWKAMHTVQTKVVSQNLFCQLILLFCIEGHILYYAHCTHKIRFFSLYRCCANYISAVLLSKMSNVLEQ